MRPLPRGFWFAATIVWTALGVATLAMVVPYWFGGHTWGIRYGRVWLLVAGLLALPAQAVYERRYESNVDDRPKVNWRTKLLAALIVVAGMIPCVVLVVVTAERAGLA